jgi:hypothetical protein
MLLVLRTAPALVVSVAGAGSAASKSSVGGDLDPTFGSGGLVTTDLTGDSDGACCVAAAGAVLTNFGGSSNDVANAIALQRDGKIVLAGESDGRVALARYLPTYCFVPNVRGRPLAAARAAIVKAHCRIGSLRRLASRTVRAGRVINQTPRAGTQQPEDASVALVISRGR